MTIINSTLRRVISLGILGPIAAAQAGCGGQPEEIKPASGPYYTGKLARKPLAPAAQNGSGTGTER